MMASPTRFKVIDDILPKTIVRIYDVHKDGSLCHYPYCKELHASYEVEFERTVFKRIGQWNEDASPTTDRSTMERRIPNQTPTAKT